MPSRLDADFNYFLGLPRLITDRFTAAYHCRKKDGRIYAILPGRVERRALKARVGYKEFTLPTVDQLAFVGQLLGENDQDTAAEIMNCVRDSLRQKEGEVALFSSGGFWDPFSQSCRPSHKCPDQSNHSPEPTKTGKAEFLVITRFS